jgi:phage/conjugal plasmid C-4 type zinc finger TraR family protein
MWQYPKTAVLLCRVLRETCEMAGGFAKDGAVQEQIDATVEDAIKHAREQLPKGESLSHCEECDKAIPEARRDAVPGVRLCIDCQSKNDKAVKISAGYNRRGSKDSQLR